jgi:hypothetical protein
MFKVLFGFAVVVNQVVDAFDQAVDVAIEKFPAFEAALKKAAEVKHG